ncbi:glycoside hydrolase family 3 N-terminal domain-containing protein [Pseudarthrobacter cellobiosi]|uniref:glycoside hydrolase family 3 N-terminal domain-containing protein n=1 Tax=Pseudarthrobacter cellobiosi TaxID=2953654 RepID=UPI00208FCB1D|nr:MULTISPECIES: glycoside hydrolase family 3 N-terminal domain-containing protein [unclassified Pseudarthrobacter]MCO4256723.1 beta-N-acetylhexosaminidase [Pseudarthrobacter sp. HLT1-5]MCO4275061.1 beta-N-acetylhexosaminidase [Pseudarthrobacter sp. HLT3-5]
MSVEEKAGQVLMPVYTGTDSEAQAATIERLHLAGSIIMGDNVPLDARGQADPAAMTAVNARLAQAATADGRPWPGLIGVDQEGGIVARLGAPLTEWPTALSYGAAGNAPLAKDAGRALAAEIASLGFTVDFAPDADVTIGPADPTIGARSMSGNPDAAGALAVAFSQGMQEAGVLPAVKHFPGHGSVTVDSHQDLPVQPAGIAELEARDWKPFRAAIAAGMPMVMTGHIAVPALEPGVPASLSGPTYAALRGMGFKGVAVTDALNMGAVQKQYPGGSAATAALAAGADLLLMPTDVGQAHAAIVGAVAAGTLPAARLDEAANRVATMLTWRGRIAPPPGAAPEGTAPGSGADISARVSAAAVTVLSGHCSAPIVQGSLRIAGGSPQDRARFEAAAAKAGLGTGAGPLVSLIGYAGRPVGGDVAVALDAPWPLQDSSAPVKIALYGRTPGAFDALVAVLAGKAAAPGKLPAAVGSYPAGTGCP